MPLTFATSATSDGGKDYDVNGSISVMNDGSMSVSISATPKIAPAPDPSILAAAVAAAEANDIPAAVAAAELAEGEVFVPPVSIPGVGD